MQQIRQENERIDVRRNGGVHPSAMNRLQLHYSRIEYLTQEKTSETMCSKKFLFCTAVLYSFVQIASANEITDALSQKILVATDADGYWAQFNAQHDPGVDMWVVLDRQVTFVLWSGKLATDTYGISWNSSSRSPTVLKNCVAITDLVTGADEKNRPIFTGDFDTVGEPMLSGLLDYDPENELVILNISAGGRSHRIAIAISQDASAVVSSDTKTCLCFGKGGGTTNTCTEQDCDEGNSCGTAADGTNKACRWKAGSSIISIEPIEVESPPMP